MATQCERILKHMQRFGGITPLEAFSDYGIMRLASRICDLKKQGVQIYTQNVKDKNRYGETVYYKIYRLAEETK